MHLKFNQPRRLCSEGRIKPSNRDLQGCVFVSSYSPLIEVITGSEVIFDFMCVWMDLKAYITQLPPSAASFRKHPHTYHCIIKDQDLIYINI